MLLFGVNALRDTASALRRPGSLHYLRACLVARDAVGRCSLSSVAMTLSRCGYVALGALMGAFMLPFASSARAQERPPATLVGGDDEASPPPPQKPEPTAEPQNGLVRIHIESDDPEVQLHRYAVTALAGHHATPGHPVITTESALLCRTPCDTWIDGRHHEEFFFTGKGVTDSSRFQAMGMQGDVTAEVDSGSQLQHTLGWVTFGVGLAGAAFGGLMYGLAVGGECAPDEDKCGVRPIERSKPVFGAIVGLGLTVAVGGIVLVVTSGTDYEFRRSERRPKPDTNFQ